MIEMIIRNSVSACFSIMRSKLATSFNFKPVLHDLTLGHHLEQDSSVHCALFSVYPILIDVSPGTYHPAMPLQSLDPKIRCDFPSLGCLQEE